MRFSWINILLGLSIIFTLSATVITALNYKKYTAKTQTISKANELLLQTVELKSIVKDAEIGQRGYLLTGKIEYLKPYLDFNSRIEVEKKKTLVLAAENAFKEDIDQLLVLITKKHADLSYTIEMKETGGLEAALKVVNSDYGNMLMDSIQNKVNIILIKERKLIAELNADYDQLTRTTNKSRYFFQFFVASMSIAAIILLTKRQKQNNVLITELNTSKADLEQVVEQRTKDLHNANQELVAQNEEIQSQSEHISTQNDLLIRLDTEKNKFVGIASHDLKSPVNRIKGLISIMRMSPDATVASQSEYFGMIDKTINGMLQLLKDLLDINKIDLGRREIHVTKIDLNWIITNICHIFSEQALAKDITIECLPIESKIEIESDESILMQIMENLVSNAIKFTESGKRITISLVRIEKIIRLEVRDQGLGIDESEMHLLFGKFQKLSSRPTAGEESTGLGLSIVKELVETIGGKIWCESKLGEGSSFIIELNA